jgi:hypothetical protein
MRNKYLILLFITLVSCEHASVVLIDNSWVMPTGNHNDEISDPNYNNLVLFHITLIDDFRDTYISYLANGYLSYMEPPLSHKPYRIYVKLPKNQRAVLLSILEKYKSNFQKEVNEEGFFAEYYTYIRYKNLKIKAGDYDIDSNKTLKQFLIDLDQYFARNIPRYYSPNKIRYFKSQIGR